MFGVAIAVEKVTFITTAQFQKVSVDSRTPYLTSWPIVNILVQIKKVGSLFFDFLGFEIHNYAS